MSLPARSFNTPSLLRRRMEWDNSRVTPGRNADCLAKPPLELPKA